MPSSIPIHPVVQNGELQHNGIGGGHGQSQAQTHSQSQSGAADDPDTNDELGGDDEEDDEDDDEEEEEEEKFDIDDLSPESAVIDLQKPSATATQTAKEKAAEQFQGDDAGRGDIEEREAERAAEALMGMSKEKSRLAARSKSGLRSGVDSPDRSVSVTTTLIPPLRLAPSGPARHLILWVHVSLELTLLVFIAYLAMASSYHLEFHRY